MNNILQVIAASERVTDLMPDAPALARELKNWLCDAAGAMSETADAWAADSDLPRESHVAELILLYGDQIVIARAINDDALAKES